MKIIVHRLGVARFLTGVLFFCVVTALAQNPPSSHVIIPNPTPRPPDLKSDYGKDSPELTAKQQDLRIRNQLRAREIWLQANQLLLLAQRLREDVLASKESAATTANSAKVAEIEKLAKSIEKTMKVQ